MMLKDRIAVKSVIKVRKRVGVKTKTKVKTRGR